MSAAIGLSHTIVVAEDKEGVKKVYGFGSNKNNKLSDKILDDIVSTPTEIEFFNE